MPAQVIVVKRPRRSLFAVPRALPDWLRSVWAALFRTAAQPHGADGIGSTGSRPSNPTLFPSLVLEADGAHRCVGCELCVRVCPTRCLSISIATESGSDGVEMAPASLTRFALATGACIGCGDCVAACPEGALVMRSATERVELAPLLGGSGVADLCPASLPMEA